MVLLRNENTPPMHWRLGRVVAVYPGKDGLIRVIDVKTSNGVLQRSLPKIWCIDCTHIRIANPGRNYGEVFRNRKGWFSLNVQVYFFKLDPNEKILDIVVRHPGSTHDAVIFDRSGLRCRFELERLDGILLGDSGYVCRSYLLTPVLRPETDAEVRYNTAHKKTRVTVKQLLGCWKHRFPCLYYGLRTKLSTSVSIICATAVLHNVCIKYNLGEVIKEEFNEPIFENIVNREQDGIGLNETPAAAQK
ncbi:PREDICTED: putative nuclease HARBI1 [Trachymyrmex cornetzi]|uniref:putative nuclease HARBI1 n=1 Tax=Trachymyrmex cornetzi TaxID=471704 RepID=UPI00084EDD66|nr:PREDICTED: putative nuclease HARBI1 [Trachymyrmex cornetzi]